MATIKKHITATGKARWQFRVRRLGQPTLCKSFALKTDAHAWARQAEAKLDRGQALPDAESRKRTLTQLIEEFNTNAPKIAFQSDRKTRLAWWSDNYGTLPLTSLDAAIVERPRKTPNCESPAERFSRSVASTG
jgi:hypothetical protein